MPHRSRSHVRDGLATSIDDIYVENYEGLVRFAAFLLGSVSEAEDAVQDVWVSMRSSRKPAHIEVAAPLAYIRRALINRCRSITKRDRMAKRFTAHIASADASYEDQHSRVDMDPLLRAMQNLPHRVRETLVLRYFTDLTISQVAAIMGISTGAIKRYTADGLEQLDRLLAREDPSHDAR